MASDPASVMVLLQSLLSVHINGSMTIRRPVETLFDYATDQSSEPTYNLRMLASKKVSEGPVGLGTPLPRHGAVRTTTA